LNNPVSIAILAGGQSSRMGTNKALSVVGGKRIIDRIIERVRGLGGELLIIANLPEDYADLGLPIHGDLIPGKGPLGGLYTAITTAQAEYVLAVSCDQPFLNVRLLQYLIDQRHGWDVVVPLAADGYPQSMHAVYGQGCLPAIQNCLAADKLKMIGFFGDVRVRTVAGEEIERIDPARHSFINVNSPEDLRQAEQIAAQDDASG
jgi:molybdenum cofactor guanylyltransferase